MCRNLTGEKVMMRRETKNFPDSDTTDFLEDYYICPTFPNDHFYSISDTCRYE